MAIHFLSLLDLFDSYCISFHPGHNFAQLLHSPDRLYPKPQKLNSGLWYRERLYQRSEPRDKTLRDHHIVDYSWAIGSSDQVRLEVPRTADRINLKWLSNSAKAPS